MNKRTVRLTALVLLVVCLFDGAALAQRRRAARRPFTSRTRFAPLTAEQKAAIADILEKAGELEVTYNYRPKEYADDAFNVSAKSGEVEEELPEGPMKDYMLNMWSAWRAAAFMYGTCLPGYKGLSHSAIEAAVRLSRTTGGREGVSDPIPGIVRQYNLQNMTPCQAQRELFNYARVITMRTRAILDASPTARVGRSPRPADDYTRPDQADAVADGRGGTTLGQVESRARELSSQLGELAGGPKANGDGASAGAGAEWAFPKQGMRGRYSEHTKGVIYDLGDAIFAGHMSLDTNQGPLPVVLIVFGVPVPRDVMSDQDLALVVASKVVSLHEGMADTAMGRAGTGEYRFRTTGGKVVGVGIAHDRKTAIARFL